MKSLRVLPLLLVFLLSACAEMPMNRAENTSTGAPGGSPPEARQPDGASGSAAAVQELVSSSRTSRDRGDHAHAQADIERALRIEPRNPYLWLELGEIHLARKDPQQASATARKAMSVAGADDRAKAAADDLLKRASRY
jgi:Tfp pilus assembly protein PilF